MVVRGSPTTLGGGHSKHSTLAVAQRDPPPPPSRTVLHCTDAEDEDCTHTLFPVPRTPVWSSRRSLKH